MDFGEVLGGAVGDIASAAIGGGLSYMGQSSANQANQQLASQQEAFQLNMDSTKYQRAVKDLQAAGLNPMMAYGNMAAGSPSGALGIAQQNPMAGVGQAISSLKPSESISRAEQTKLMREQQGQTVANTAKSEADTKLIEQQKATSRAQELDALASVGVKATQARLNSAQTAKTMSEASYVDAQRAEVSAKQPLWNMFKGAAKTAEDVAHSSSAQNVRRAADNIRSISFPFGERK